MAVGEARHGMGGRTASESAKRSPQEAGQGWLTPDVRAFRSEPEARSSDLLRFQDTERQSPEQLGPGPGPGVPADPGWLVALETASCSGQAPGWCNLGGPVTFLLASGPRLRGKGRRGGLQIPEHLGGPFLIAQGLVGLTFSHEGPMWSQSPWLGFPAEGLERSALGLSAPHPLPLPSVPPAQLSDQGGGGSHIPHSDSPELFSSNSQWGVTLPLPTVSSA